MQDRPFAASTAGELPQAQAGTYGRVQEAEGQEECYGARAKAQRHLPQVPPTGYALLWCPENKKYAFPRRHFIGFLMCKLPLCRICSI